MTCTGLSTCFAVGTGGNNQTLIESWNGSTWSISGSPNTNLIGNVLSGVSCTSSTACTAVGYSYDGSGDDLTLTETWNGSIWSIVSSPNTSAQMNILSGVSCTGSTTCMAVGYSQTPETTQPLAEAWNGSVWSIVSNPSDTPANGSLEGVSCTVPTMCMAVGSFVGSFSQFIDQTLVETWNGSAWSLVSSPNTSPSEDNVLKGVSCTTPAGCTAVGSFGNATLIESWNGGGWTIVPSPDTLSGGGLEGVSCTGLSTCAAVGEYNSNGPTLTLAMFTNGGYRLVASDGGIFAFNAPFYGSMGGKHLDKPVVGIAADAATGGYWEVASDGGIFAFNAPFYGSMGGKPLNKPMVGIAADAATGGYWEVASDGGIFAFNAPVLRFHGWPAPQQAHGRDRR